MVVGTETAVFSEGSPVRQRILAYTEAFAHTDIIVMCGPGFKKERVSERVTLYPTNSRSRFFRVFDAMRIGRALPRADIVSVQDPFETGYAGMKIARRMQARLHVQVHTDFLSPEYARGSLVNLVRRALARAVIARADRIRVVSGRIKHSLEARYHPRAAISVLPIFVDIERFRRAIVPPQLAARFARFSARLLVVSRLEQEKNVSLAIRAFAASAPRDACLIIVGDGRQRPLLEALSHTLGVADRIFFEGRQDAAPYYAAADLVLFPSKYDGYGLVIIEALAAGKPVLSTDVGIAREAGAIVAEPDAFVAALSDWFASGPQRATLNGYPYKNNAEYVLAYGADIVACGKRQKKE